MDLILVCYLPLTFLGCIQRTLRAFHVLRIPTPIAATLKGQALDPTGPIPLLSSLRQLSQCVLPSDTLRRRSTMHYVGCRRDYCAPVREHLTGMLALVGWAWVMSD